MRTTQLTEHGRFVSDFVRLQCSKWTDIFWIRRRVKFCRLGYPVLSASGSLP
jgi:hypothetical protein